MTFKKSTQSLLNIVLFLVPKVMKGKNLAEQYFHQIFV